MEPINPSVWRRAKRNTARKVNAVRIAKGEYQGCPPRVVRGAARHPSMASSENHTVRLPRWRRLASYSRQFITFRFCLGIWWRRSWFSLNGKMGIRRSQEGQSSYVGPARSATGRIHATMPSTGSRYSLPKPLHPKREETEDGGRVRLRNTSAAGWLRLQA